MKQYYLNNYHSKFTVNIFELISEFEETPMYYENYDLDSIVMPVNTEKLVQLFHEAQYDTDEIEFLKKGFSEGFDIGYEGPSNRQSTAENIPLTVGSKTELWNKLMKEVKLKRVAGPYAKIPFENYVQSPIGLVPKAGSSDQTRLIFHLSFDKGEDGIKSINHFTPKEYCSVKYRDLDYAVRTYINLSQEASGVPKNLTRTELKNRWREKFNSNHQRKKEIVIFSGKSDLKVLLGFWDCQNQVGNGW